MKKDFETTFTAWTLIVAAIMLLAGWLLLPHHLGEYLVASDFEAVNQNHWYWVWIYRVHIFGWVIMGGGMIALAAMLNGKPYRIMVVPGAGIVVVGTFTIALAVAFYYSFGAWGVGKTVGKSAAETQLFMDSILDLNHYVTCMMRFGRIFSGVGFMLLGVGLFKWKIVDAWLGIFTILMGLVAMCIILFIHDNFEVYKPMFYVKVVWLAVMGITLLTKGVKLPQTES